MKVIYRKQGTHCLPEGVATPTLGPYEQEKWKFNNEVQEKYVKATKSKK